RRAALQRENAAELPAPEKKPRRALEALSPRNLPHVSGDKTVPDIVQAAGPFRCAIARVLALARSAIDGLGAVIDQVRPGVSRSHADTFCEAVLVPALERMVNGIAARIDHANTVVLRVGAPRLIERQQAGRGIIEVVEAG